MAMAEDRFGARAELPGGLTYFRLEALARRGVGDVSRLPMTLKILLENLLRHAGDQFVTDDDVAALAGWDGRPPDQDRERAFVPSRVLLQDFTGVPAVVDLAAMRSAVQRSGGDPSRIDPLVPVDLVIDHSVQVDAFGSAAAYGRNIEREYQRNHERYALLRWAQQAFHGFRVVPPGMGIVHQINLEYLADTVTVRELDGVRTAFPDTVVGTDSHTPMVNGVGVLGWGVGGIEAEACMLGQPLFLLTPVVVGVRFHNALAAGTTATDLVLTLTEMLRRHGVVNKFVEFCGSGLSSMSVPDRATLSNMSPEFGATASLFPVDDQTLRYLRDTGRDPARVLLVERYCKEQGLFRTDQSETPVFTELLDFDLATVEPSVAGPRRPQDRVSLGQVRQSFEAVYGPVAEGGTGTAGAEPSGPPARELGKGAVVIAAITSCTNTSNPSVMVAAGLLAAKAAERGLRPPSYVKTSLAPGSRVVTDYLERAGLLAPLASLGFDLVGYGCTTCIGNSGPLPAEVAAEVEGRELAVCAVLSGNRNFEGRIHPQVRRRPSPRRRWWSPSRWRGRWTSTSPASRSARAPTAGRCSCTRSGRALRRSAGRWRVAWAGTSSAASIRASSRATQTGRSCRRRQGRCSSGTRTRPTCASPASSPRWTPRPGRSPMSRAHGRSPISATPSPRTTSPRRGASRPARPRRATCASTLSSHAISTPTAPGGAITR